MLRFFGTGAVVLTFAGVLAGMAWTDRYIKEDPAFCGLCHRPTPEFASLDHGQHRELRCQECHHTGQDQGLTLLRGFLTSQSAGQGVAHATVEIGACESCHLSHDRRWQQVGASRGHRIHVVDEQIPCAACHLEQGHRFVPTIGSCKECHGPHVVNTVGMQKLHCFACHDFLSVKETLRPSRRDCLRCHREEGLHPSRFPPDAPMQFACAECHRPHVPPGEEHIPCLDCHEGIGEVELHALPDHRVPCVDCHVPHEWKSDKGACFECHEELRKHYPKYPCLDCHEWGPGPTPKEPATQELPPAPGSAGEAAE